MVRVTTACSALVVALGLLVAVATPASAAKPGPGSMDCFADLLRGTSSEIICDFPLRPSETERADLERQSRGYVKDARCTVSIRIPRSAVLDAVNNPDYVFAAPEQPVQCEVTAQFREGQPPHLMPITASFAPRVTIRDGRAIDATPGLANVTGVPRALSWPVEAWVNSGIGIKSNMLQVINAWLDHMRHTSPRRAAASSR